MNYTSDLSSIDKYLKDEKKNEIIARMGLRTNGDLHMGNILPFVASFIIGNRAIKQKHNYKLLIFLVDYEFNDDNQKPFIYQPDKNKCHTSLAEHSINIIKSFVNDLRKNNPHSLKVSMIRISELMKTQKFKEIIINKIIPIGKAYPVCEKCKTINQKYKYSNNIINFVCKNCKTTYKISPEKIIFTTSHDMLGAIVNSLYPIDIHIIGKDHSLENKNKKTAFQLREEYKKLLGDSKDYITFTTPLVYRQ